MRMAKRFFTSICVILLALYCFRGSLYRWAVAYRELGQRALIGIEDEGVKKDLDGWLLGHKNATMEQVVDYAREYAAKDICYTLGKCPTNPNVLLTKRQDTNCVGYSAAFHAVVTYLFTQKHMNSTVKCEHKVGKLHFWGYDLHRLFRDPVFKDHDYNVITDKTTGQRYVIDPTLSAYMGIHSVRD
jgi:hypothetical protein